MREVGNLLPLMNVSVCPDDEKLGGPISPGTGHEGKVHPSFRCFLSHLLPLKLRLRSVNILE